MDFRELLDEEFYTVHGADKILTWITNHLQITHLCAAIRVQRVIFQSLLSQEEKLTYMKLYV